MGRKTETDEQKVKKVYPDARCVWYINSGNILWYYVFEDKASDKPCLSMSESETQAWYEALKQINAAKRKKYYKRKITRPNNEIKGKVTIMLYPSDRTAIIGKYGSVQKFINDMVSKVK